MASKTLSDVCDIVMGQSPAGEMCNTSGVGIPLLNGPTEYGPHHPTPVQFTTDARKFAKAGDLLFCVRGSTTGRMNWADRDYAIGRGVAAIRHKSQRKLQPLVRAVVEFHLPSLLTQATGSTFPNVSSGMLSALPWPDLDEHDQRVAAHILGTLDDKIELNRKQNETLEAMARALFKAWFVDFEPVRAKMEGRWQRDQSLPGLSAHLYDLFPDRLVESELGEVPEGWKYAPLSEFIEILDSRRVPLSGKQRAERRGIYPYHGAAGVMDFVDDYLFDGIHVLIGEDGSVVKDDGRPYTQYVWGKFWVNNHAHVLRGRGITNETLLIFLDQCDIAPFVTGAVQPKLSQGNLKKIPFIDAGEWLLNGFGEVISPLFKKIRDATEELRALVQIRDTLLPKLISGELRVPDVDKFMEAMA